MTRNAAAFRTRPLDVKDPTTVALKEVLQLGDEEDIDDLMDFATKTRPEPKAIVLAGLRALRSEAPSLTVPHSSNLGLGDGRHILQRASFQFPNIVSMFPSVFANGITLRHQTTREVYYQNARSIGLSLEDIMRPDCSLPFSNSLSLSSMLLSWPTVPPDLRPTPSQLRFPHHPFLDLIPFPWF